MHTEVTALDLDRRRVRTRDGDGTERWTGYDKLVLATGARPLRPPLPGIDAPGVYGVQSLDDGQALLDGLVRPPAVRRGGARRGRRRRLHRRGDGRGPGAPRLPTSPCWTRPTQPMTTLDPDMGALVRDAMTGMGIETVTGAAVTGIRTGDDGRVRAVPPRTASTRPTWSCSASASAPRPTLAAEAGLPLGASGGLLTDLAMRVRGQEDVWAGGDCVEVLDLVSGRTRHIALGTHANKHGQVIGTNIGGGYATFPGVVGTAVSKVCDLEIARTGLLEAQAARGRPAVRDRRPSSPPAGPGYYPGAATMTGQDARRAAHRPAAGRADRRPRGRGQAGRRRRRSR